MGEGEAAPPTDGGGGSAVRQSFRRHRRNIRRASDRTPPTVDTGETAQRRHNDRVSSATYPTPRPLARLLRAAVERFDEDGVDSKGAFRMTRRRRVELESIEVAVEHLLRNSFEAVDQVYFSTHPDVRKRRTFAHRLCLRVSTDIERGTLSITDLGAGMTRADLINALGVGHLSHEAHHVSRVLGRTKEKKEEGGDEVGVGFSSDDEVSSSSSSDTEADTGENDGSKDGVKAKFRGDGGEDDRPPRPPVAMNGALSRRAHSPLLIPCRASDIGGFYSSVCTLGVGVNIGTKSKFDDYYEFDLGLPMISSAGRSISDSMANFSHFVVTRPMDEGERPTAANGYGSFCDVRGDSGTRVTIRLNPDAITAGVLNEEQVLKPMLSKILETSPYSVAFASDPEAESIIDASRLEHEEEEARKREVEEEKGLEDVETLNFSGSASVEPYSTVKARSKYIPLRLSLSERKMLRLLEAAMTCCDYTTDVDRQFRSSARRTHTQLRGISAVLRGLVTACDYAAGQKLLAEDNFSDYEKFFWQMFEIARRHKIMNPEKMRTEYGKLVYLLQDAVSPSVQPHLCFSCKAPIETVYKFLEEKNGLALLDDKLIEAATQEILSGKKSRAQISTEIKRKERAVALLKQNYTSTQLSPDDIHLCLYSICDNNSFLNSNRVPVDKIISYLKEFFSPGTIDEGYDLSIVTGKDGARLSHSHERQFYFALQSLMLWRDIIDDMFRLWYMAEEDLLSETVTYALKDTGQGMQRVQQSPRTYKAMQKILSRVQGKVSQWVGSSVIHLGDHNVPNALSFIDKYTQVPRILGPIVSCLENLERICNEDDGIKAFVDSGFGGIECLKKDILYDFIKSAFDGSGADNFYDAGSCIDGRLTSAWNWCSQLPSKPFYCIFKLTGFTGFDGEFK